MRSLSAITRAPRLEPRQVMTPTGSVRADRRGAPMRKSRKDHLLSMRFVSPSLAFCGFVVVLWLLYQNDYRAVLRTIADIGGGLAIVVLIRGVLLAVCGLAWWCLLRGLAAVRVPVVAGLRTVGEAVNVLLPVAAVGGDVVRARLLNLSGVAGGLAAASALIDLLLQAAAQALFALVGVALLMQVAGATELASWAARGVGVAVLALGGFYAAQRFGGARIVERGLAALARRSPATARGSAIRLHESLQAIYADRPAVMVRRAQTELDGFVRLLEAEGVRVRRPAPIDQRRRFQTRLWSSRGFCLACPRYLYLVVGDEIIETPTCWRSCHFAARSRVTFGWIAWRSVLRM
jgi:hypothetical protein